MPYPNSFDVFDGMPTAYQHYNNLRADALYLGQSEANAVPLGAALARYESGLTIELLDLKRLRVPATAAAPVGLVIGGYPLQVVANVDLSTGAAPSGPAAEYWIFAVRSSGQTGFSLDVNTTPVETSTRRIIGRCWYDGSKILRDSIRTTFAEGLRGALHGLASTEAGGRLTLAPGSPWGEATAAGTIYYTPAVSARISLFVPGFGWKVYSFGEAALPLDGLTAGNYDIFGHNTSGEGYALQLAAVKWSSDTARATAIVRQNGVWVRNGLPEQRYLGTIRLHATAACTDNPERRLVWNCYNRVPRRLYKRNEGVNSWAANTAGVWRAANADTSLRVEIVAGLEDAFLELGLSVTVSTQNAVAMVAVGKNSVLGTNESDNHQIVGYSNNLNTAAHREQIQAWVRGVMDPGFAFYQWCEYTSAACTFWVNQVNGHHGLHGFILG